MTPADLSATSFTGYSPEARAFALQHLSLLQKLPLAICPSFLERVQGYATLFPAEADLLQWQCDTLTALPAPRLTALTAPLEAITLPSSLRAMDWLASPSLFITDLTAHLWASDQIDHFRAATNALFAAVPPQRDPSERLVIVVLGQGANPSSNDVLRKLRTRGVTFSALKQSGAWPDICTLLRRPLETQPKPYSAWYVDGGVLQPTAASCFTEGGIAVDYAALAPIRQSVLTRMQTVLSSGAGGAEQMRTRMMQTSTREADAHTVSSDPVLQRFYTELFTASSGPQIFSTSFVQWTARELARRARPQRLLLRYAPRQRQRDMNAMFFGNAPRSDAPGASPDLDPQGSLIDAEMGAFYTWLEMNRITAPGRLTFVAWLEDQPLAVVLGRNAPAGAVSANPVGLAQAVQSLT